MREQSSGGVMMAGIKSSPAGPSSEAGNPSNLRWVSGPGELGKKVNVEDQKRRIREAEKAEKLMHLICWGPHSIRF